MLSPITSGADLAQDTDVITVHAELHGEDEAEAFGYSVRSPSPIIRLCRDLVDAGCFPFAPLVAYRGGTVCLVVRSIGEAAQLGVENDKFRRAARYGNLATGAFSGSAGTPQASEVSRASMANLSCGRTP